MGPRLTWLGWGSAALADGGALVDRDVIHLCILMDPGEGQRGSGGIMELQKPEVGSWRPVRSSSLISGGNNGLTVPWLQMPLQATGQTRQGALWGH